MYAETRLDCIVQGHDAEKVVCMQKQYWIVLFRVMMLRRLCVCRNKIRLCCSELQGHDAEKLVCMQKQY